MPKMKSHTGARKRIKKLKSGLFKATRTARRHLLTKKESSRKRQMRKSKYINPVDLGHIARLLPY